MAEKQLKSIKFPGLDDIYIIPEGGNIDIDLEESNIGEPNPINADTLDGYYAKDFALASDVSIQINTAIEQLRQEILGGAW